MLRVGLTGGLGSGKSTVAAMLRDLGAHVLSADEIGRELMQPGEPVYEAIVELFGPGVVLSSGYLDRAALAQLAFAGGRVEELNAIVHPAVIARQAELAAEIEGREPEAVVVVESALIFETRYAAESASGAAEAGAGGRGWRGRFDRIVLVTAGEEKKIERYVERSAKGGALDAAERQTLEGEARRRLDQQIPDERKAAECDYVLTNDGSLEELQWQVDALWNRLQEDVAAMRRGTKG